VVCCVWLAIREFFIALYVPIFMHNACGKFSVIGALKWRRSEIIMHHQPVFRLDKGQRFRRRRFLDSANDWERERFDIVQKFLFRRLPSSYHNIVTGNLITAALKSLPSGTRKQAVQELRVWLNKYEDYEDSN
jgi:hypothetical protein